MAYNGFSLWFVHASLADKVEDGYDPVSARAVDSLEIESDALET
jgi:hypothetical protein